MNIVIAIFLGISIVVVVITICLMTLMRFIDKGLDESNKLAGERLRQIKEKENKNG